MFWIVVITLYNALMSSESVVNPARISIGVAKLGMNELLTAIAFLWAVFQGGTIQSRYPRLRTHPLIFWLIGVWIVAWVLGSVGSIGTAITPKDLMTAMREYAAAAIYIFIGYRLLATPRSVYWVVYLAVIAGVLNALILMMRFGQGAQLLMVESDNINPLRQIEYPTYYAVVGFTILIWSVLSGAKLLRTWLALLLAGVCLLGALAAVSRTTAVCLAAEVLALILIIPHGTRTKAMFKMALVIPVMLGALMLGIKVASDATGKNFYRVVERQIESLTPRDENSTTLGSGKAWDTRIPSMLCELDIFYTNPLIGQGFGGVADYLAHGGTNWGAFGHNSFTGIMAATGVVGLLAMSLTAITPLWIGYRMCKARLDTSTMAAGALGYIVGLTVLVFGICTMIFFTRTAMYFGLFCGMMVRAREIEETTRALQATEGYGQYDEDELPLADDHGYSPLPGF